MTKPKRRPNFTKIIAAIAAVIATLGIAITVSVDENGSPTVTVRVDGPDRDTRPDDPLVLNERAQGVLEDAQAAPERFDLGGELRGPDPARAGRLEGPLAAQEWPGCKTAFVRSFSSRRGVKPTAIAWHYTAGANRAGWADLDGLTAYSNTIANQVSWHFGIDREGNCTFNVPTNYKAWTISALNSQTVNIEVVGTGKEPDYAGPGFEKVRDVTRRIAAMYSIPLQLGAVNDCQVTKPGIITHWMGGACSGGHIDIRPYPLPPLIARLAAPTTGAARLPGPVPKPAWFWLAVGEWDRRQAP